jgi:beta-xylosidase
MAEMTLAEKVAQLSGVWIGSTTDGEGVAPHQNDMGDPIDLDALLPQGLGQLTRSFGTNPVEAAVGAAGLARLQRRIAGSNRFGIPAVAHEECLAGFTTWGATAYPVPLSWGATFSPELIERMGRQIGDSMRAVGVHQGLAPVLDVTVDPRWGRTEETIAEDPYTVGVLASSYIRGLEKAGVVATLKHFAGYSASRGARNLAPVRMGSREFADTILAPFEMAIRESGVRSVMHAYTDTDGVPSAADSELLTTLLRDTWGFEGTVVADYFGVGFLKLLHGTAETWGEAGSQAITAGVDVELPIVTAYGAPLVAEVESGRLSEEIIDRSLFRVLTQKIELGLLDPRWTGLPEGWSDADIDADATTRPVVDLDPASGRELAKTIAEQAAVLVRNTGILPLDQPKTIVVVGPTADDVMTMLGCYSFPNHVGANHPGLPLGIEIPTVLTALRAEFPLAVITSVAGCSIDGDDTGGIEAAVAAAADADVVVLAVGDRAGLFGRGTSGEGCDAETLRLPGVQADLLERILDASENVVVTVLSGRPYSLGTAPERAAAVLQTFFPGEEGGSAIAGILSGRVNPSGHLPVSIPAREGGQPWTYLGARLSYPSEVSNIDTTPAFAFGHGLTYTRFDWEGFTVDADLDQISEPTRSEPTGSGTDLPLEIATDGSATVRVTVRNAGDRDGHELVQLYFHDPVASVTRPVSKLIAFQKVALAAAAEATVTLVIPADVFSFTGRDGRRIVEAGDIELLLGTSSSETKHRATLRLAGTGRVVDHTRELHCRVTVS